MILGFFDKLKLKKKKGNKDDSDYFAESNKDGNLFLL